MGCTSGTNEKKDNQPNKPPIQEVNFVFQLSTGGEYNIQAKENEQFQTVLDKFIEDHQEINNKTVNLLYNNNKIDLYKSVSENNIQNNNLILLNIEPEPKSDNEAEPEHDNESDTIIQYIPENVIWIDENVDNF